MVTLETRTRQVPPRAAVLSLLAFAVPVVTSVAFPTGLEDYEALLWLVALVPAFLFAFHKGWKGAATALAVGMAILSTTGAFTASMGQPVPKLLPAVVAAYVAISLGIGWLAELMLRERDEVEDLAFTDTLTRLPNRRHAELFLENEFAAAERGRALAVVLFDLDRFKAYNDTHGHEAGDDALRAFAEVLVRTTRRMNLAARFGGEEFVAVLAGSDVKGATVFANRVRKELIGLSIGPGPLTVSAGVAGFTPSMTEPKHLLAAADRALYEAKRDGRDRVVTIGGEMDDPEAWATATREDGSPSVPAGAIPPICDGRSVLVAEGDAKVRELLGAYLATAGFEVSEVADGPDAMRALAREYDVVITDLRLNGVGGEEIIRAVKSRHPLTGVLVLTALQDAHVAADALQAGADRYLFKPFGMPELRAHLVDALAQRDRLIEEAERGRRLSPEGRERADAAREAILNGARALVKAVEVRDPYTAGASERVARYSAVIADALDPEQSLIPREPLRIGCELHDVGKIGVPDGVLNKRGTLDAEEMEAIRRHPRIGRKILEPLIDDPIILAITSWHHESWDGTGYPDGLRGAAIPLAARVVAVADALDALTRPRAWRSARSWEEALTIIRDASATSFDPAVVDACLSRTEELQALGEAAQADS